MTSLNHQEPDRVPFDLGSTVVTGIQQKAYVNLLALMGESDRELLPILDIKQQLARPHEDILERLGVDITSVMTHLGRTDQGPVSEDDDFYYMYDAWGIGWHMPKVGGLYYDMFDHPLDGATLDDAKNFAWPDPLAAVDLEPMEAQARRIYEETDKAMVIGGFGAGILELYLWMLGFEYGFMSLVANEPLANYVMDKILEIKIAYDEAVLPVMAKHAQIYYAGDDVGHQSGPALHPDMLRKLVFSRHKQHHEVVKRLAPHLKILFHTCGSVYQVIPDLIEAGVDILNPVQVSAAEMDTARLKREFGDSLSFWGGVDTQHVLPYGTPQDVKDEVKRRIDDLAPGGGYVLNSVHNVQGDVPPENIVAMGEALDEYGWY